MVVVVVFLDSESIMNIAFDIARSLQDPRPYLAYNSGWLVGLCTANGLMSTVLFPITCLYKGKCLVETKRGCWLFMVGLTMPTKLVNPMPTLRDEQYT